MNSYNTHMNSTLKGIVKLLAPRRNRGHPSVFIPPLAHT